MATYGELQAAGQRQGAQGLGNFLKFLMQMKFQGMQLDAAKAERESAEKQGMMKMIMSIKDNPALQESMWKYHFGDANIPDFGKAPGIDVTKPTTKMPETEIGGFDPFAHFQETIGEKIEKIPTTKEQEAKFNILKAAGVTGSEALKGTVGYKGEEPAFIKELKSLIGIGIVPSEKEIKEKTGFVEKGISPAKTVWGRFFQLFPEATVPDMIAFNKELAQSKAASTRSMTELENLAGGYFPGKTLKTLSPDERLFLSSKLFQLRKMNMLALLLAMKGEEGGLEMFERPSKEELGKIGRKEKATEAWTDAEEDELYQLLELKQEGKIKPDQETKLQGLRNKKKRLRSK